MEDKNIIYDLTSADSKIIGFDFQYFYFIYKLLHLQEGEKIGYESRDDVHIETNDSQILFQLKHTTNKKADGSPVNLTDLDGDLWKTISHWVDIIMNQKIEAEQLALIQKTEFVLATNKSIGSNRFISHIENRKSEIKKTSDICDLIDELYNSAKDNSDSKRYLSNIRSLSKNVLKEFLNHIKFIGTGDDIVEDIKKSIRGMMIHKSRVNDVFNSLLSELKQEFFSLVKEKKHQEITYDEWIAKFGVIFENNRSTKLPIRTHKKTLPDNPFERPFIKELIEIGDIDKDDVVQVSDFLSQMLELEMNLSSFHTDGLLIYDEIEDFHHNSTSIWKTSHRKNHRSTNNDESDKSNALNCLDEIREKDLTIKGTDLPRDLSNGEFYYLSDKQRIGWKKKWKEKYT